MYLFSHVALTFSNYMGGMLSDARKHSPMREHNFLGGDEQQEKKHRLWKCFPTQSVLDTGNQERMVGRIRKQGNRSSLAQEKVVAHTILVVQGSGFDIRNEIRHPRIGLLRGCQRLRFSPGRECSYRDEAMVSGLVSCVNGRSLAVPTTSLSAVHQYYSRSF